MVVIDTNKKGLDAVFGRPWKSATMEYMFSSADEVKSSQVHEYLVTSGYEISRASVINFLRDMRGEGWLDSYLRSGLGGMHDVYHRNVDVDGFLDRVRELVLQSLSEKVNNDE